MRSIMYFNGPGSIVSRLLPLLRVEERKVSEWIKFFCEIAPRVFKWRAASMPPGPMILRCPGFYGVPLMSYAGSTTYFPARVVRLWPCIGLRPRIYCIGLRARFWVLAPYRASTPLLGFGPTFELRPRIGPRSYIYCFRAPVLHLLLSGPSPAFTVFGLRPSTYHIQAKCDARVHASLRTCLGPFPYTLTREVSDDEVPLYEVENKDNRTNHSALMQPSSSNIQWL
ncbi:hypothetical protein CRG98_020303 [Punica granatum]|uniref:Uncharacterized protein n=1 Tax=Punica granatum TaxID=22663 RepID=A0A2I0JSS6_PUNGR|nr:hypothetical protein CRG98_020303 [Punica granatum]